MARPLQGMSEAALLAQRATLQTQLLTGEVIAGGAANKSFTLRKASIEHRLSLIDQELRNLDPDTYGKPLPTRTHYRAPAPAFV